MDDSFIYGAVVCDNETIIFPLITQQMCEEPVVACGRYAVDNIERRHERACSRCSCSLIRFEILVEHAQAAHIDSVIVTPCLCSPIEGEMLHTGHHILLGVVALISFYHSLGYPASEPWVFS